MLTCRRFAWIAGCLSASALLLVVACRAGDPPPGRSSVAGSDAESGSPKRGDSVGAIGRARRDSLSAPGNYERGFALLTAFKDSLPAHSGNSLTCTSCHLDGGVRSTAMTWIGSAARYPRFRSRSASEESLEQRVNDCVMRSLAGVALSPDSRDMRDIIAYLGSLGSLPRPVGPDTVRLAGNVNSGRGIYATDCARCHGASGEGLIAPAVYGVNSYSIGAGMARQKMLATFVRHNMPYDKLRMLSEQEAADVAAFVLAQPRQDFPDKELDWPRGDPPADAAYPTDAARIQGKAMPAPRPLLPRVVK